MTQLTKTIIAVAIATSVAGSAYAASRTFRDAVMTGDGWSNAQSNSYDYPSPGDQPKGNIH
jgi:hypothetical protein